MVKFIFKFPVHFISALLFFLWFVLSGGYKTVYNQCNQDRNAFTNAVMNKFMRYIQFVDRYIPYFWAVVFIFAANYMFKGHV